MDFSLLICTIYYTRVASYCQHIFIIFFVTFMLQEMTSLYILYYFMFTLSIFYCKKEPHCTVNIQRDPAKTSI